MKPLTNILLVAYLIVYSFMPLFEVALDGDWNGLKYTAETISNAESLLNALFALLPFAVGFGAIAINCMKTRYWGLVAAALICCGLYFYADAKDFIHIQVPQFFHIKTLGMGFNIGYGLLLAALVSAVLSVLPFSFNKFLAREIRTLRGKKEEQTDTTSTPSENL